MNVTVATVDVHKRVRTTEEAMYVPVVTVTIWMPMAWTVIWVSWFGLLTHGTMRPKAICLQLHSSFPLNPSTLYLGLLFLYLLFSSFFYINNDSIVLILNRRHDTTVFIIRLLQILAQGLSHVTENGGTHSVWKIIYWYNNSDNNNNWLNNNPSAYS